MPLTALGSDDAAGFYLTGVRNRRRNDEWAGKMDVWIFQQFLRGCEEIYLWLCDWMELWGICVEGKLNRGV